MNAQFGVGLYARAWSGMWIVLDQLAGLGPAVLTDREQWPDRKGMSWLSDVYVPYVQIGNGQRLSVKGGEE